MDLARKLRDDEPLSHEEVERITLRMGFVPSERDSVTDAIILSTAEELDSEDAVALPPSPQVIPPHRSPQLRHKGRTNVR